MAKTFMLLSAAGKVTTIPGEHIDMMWSTVVTGLVVVFLILALLVFFLWAMGKIMNIKKKPKETPKTEEPVKAAAPVPAPAAEEIVQDEDDEEIIAVIAAAIAAYGESEGKQYRVASVKRKEKALRSSWSAAGISENTRPF